MQYLKIIVSIGNHDQMRHISTTTLDMFDYLKIDGLTVFQKFGTYSIRDDLHIILMPYRDRRMTGAKANSDAIEIIREDLYRELNAVSGKKIIVGHFMMEKYPDTIEPDGFSINELMLPLNMFNDCNAVIMGHIHEPKVVSSEKPLIMYSGSMERNAFGEKGYKKTSIILDPDSMDFEIIDNAVRELYEIEIDYTEKGEKFKDALNDIIISDIDKFNEKHTLKNSIVKVLIKVMADDLTYADEALISKHINDHGIHNCSDIRIYATHNRQLRNAEINETLTTKDAFTKYMKGKKEYRTEELKEMLRLANNIIDEVDGK